MMATTEFRKGQRNFLRGEYGKSIMDFRIAMERGMDGVMIHVPLGLAHLKNGDFPEAVGDLSRALALDRKNDHVLFLRAIAYFNNDELEKAVDDLDHAIRLNGMRGAAYVARSLAMKAMHRAAEAEIDMKTALALGDVEVEHFIREYCISSSMYRLAMSLFEVEKESWTDELRERRREREH